MSEVLKCPKCGGQLQKGFLYLPRGALWDAKRRYVYSYSARSSGWLFDPWMVPRAQIVEAWKCPNCRLAIFGYEREKP
jgi:Domain of unknown function (DUF6487)